MRKLAMRCVCGLGNAKNSHCNRTRRIFRWLQKMFGREVSNNFFAKCFAQNLLSWQLQLRVRGVSANPIRKTLAFHVVISLFRCFSSFRLLKTPHICSINGFLAVKCNFCLCVVVVAFSFCFSAFAGLSSWAFRRQYGKLALLGGHNNLFLVNIRLLFWHYIVKYFGTQAQTLRLYKCTQFYNVLDRGIK